MTGHANFFTWNLKAIELLTIKILGSPRSTTVLYEVSHVNGRKSANLVLTFNETFRRTFVGRQAV